MNPQEENKGKKAPGIFGVIGENSPEDMQFTDADGTVATRAQERANEKKERPTTVLSSIFAEICSPKVSLQVDDVSNIVSEAKGTDEGKAKAREALLDIVNEKKQSGEVIGTTDDLMEAISDKINTLRMQANQQESQDNPYSQAAGVLSTVYNKLKFSKAKGTDMGAPINTRASVIQSMNIEGMRKATQGKAKPWAVKFYDRYDIDNYHRIHNIGLNTPIYFITDSEWTAEVTSQMKEAGMQYSTLNDMPVVAVIAVNEPTETEAKTYIEINGQYYQPIAVMSSSEAHLSGAEWTRELRRKASQNQGTHFITEDGLPNGKPTTATVYGKNYRTGYHRDSLGTTKRDNSKKNDTNIMDDIFNFLPEEERARLKAMPREQMLEDEAYKKARNQRVHQIEWDEDEQSPTANHVVLRPNRMRGNANEKAQGMIVQPTALEDSKGRTTGTPLAEVLQNEDTGAVRSFNSRTQRLFDEVLRPMFQFLLVQDKHRGDRSALCITQQTLEENPGETAVSIARKEADRLTAWLNGYDPNDKSTSGIPGVKSLIYVNPKAWKLQVVYNENDTTNTIGADQATSTTKYEIYLMSTDGNTHPIHLATIDAGKNNTDQAAEFIRNLLYDKAKGEFRQNIRWQLPAEDAKLLKPESTGSVASRAKQNYSAMIDDGILNFAGSASQYNITGIQLRSPSGMKLPTIVEDKVSNDDNAKQTASIDKTPQAENSVTTTTGEQVEANSGVQVDESKPMNENKEPGVPKPQQSQAYKEAKATAEKIVADSKNFVLSEDENYYYVKDKVTGEITKYARVTSIIKADESVMPYYPTNAEVAKHLSKEGVLTEAEFNSIRDIKTLSDRLQVPVARINRAVSELRAVHNKTAYGAWATPSSAIGTTIDAIVRDFFAGEVKESYPNVNKNDVTEFVKQLSHFMENLNAEGIHIVPNGVTAHGTVTMTDKNGGRHDVKVAGTLDLFGYDDYGNFYIFDMKTTRNHSNQKLQTEKGKWSRQVSLYADLLNQSYGINIAKENLRIIPINVDYPTPQGSRSEYLAPDGPVYAEGENHQLILTDRKGSTKEFDESQPKMVNTDTVQFPVGYTELQLNWDNLSSVEQDIADGLYEEAPEKVKQASPQEAHVEKQEGVVHGNAIGSSQIIDNEEATEKAVAPPVVQNGKAKDLPLWKELSKEKQAYLADNWGIETVDDYNEILNSPADAEALKHDLKCKGLL